MQGTANPNNPVAISRFAISSDSADRGRSIIRVRVQPAPINFCTLPI
jgi:hypothetical protein